MNLIEEYIRLADEWGRSMDDGNSAAANAQFERIQDVYRGISDAKLEDELYAMTDAVSDPACFFIASHLKEKAPQKARLLYERLAASNVPFVAISAKYIVKELNVR